MRDAEAHAEDDRRKKEEIELKNTAESSAYNAEKLLKEHADRVPADLKTEVEGKIAEVRAALQGDDNAKLKAAVEGLQTSLQKIGEQVYSQAGAAGRSSLLDRVGRAAQTRWRGSFERSRSRDE